MELPIRQHLARSLTVKGVERSYLLSLPPGFSSFHPVPVILAFHGGGGSPAAFAAMTHLSEEAVPLGFVVVYPEGMEKKWNVGKSGSERDAGIDDVAFVNAIIADLESLVGIGRDHLFAVGFSNGGMLVYKLACELSHRMAAIAVVASSLGLWDARPAHPVALLHIHGIQDPIWQFSGGEDPDGSVGITWIGVPTTIARWVEWNGMGGWRPVISKQGNAIFVTYGSSPIVNVVLCIIEELGHQWPGGKVVPGLGPGVDAPSATRLILDFFRSRLLDT